jgi:anti-sigma factor RsiW
MRHPKDGDIRRLLDEPQSVAASVRRHVQDCPECGARLAEMRADVEQFAQRFAVGERSHIDAAAARERLRAQLLQGRQARQEAVPMRRMPYGKVAGWSAAAAVLLAVGMTPIGSYAKGLLLIFQPQTFQAIPIAPAEVAGLPNLQEIGTMHGTRQVRLDPVANRAAAAAEAGFPVLSASAGVPAGFDAPVYGVLPSRTASLTLSAAKIEAYAQTQHLQLPPLPADIAGSTISVTTGPAVATIYGGSLSSLWQQSSATAKGSTQANATGGLARMPRLVIVQAPVPKVYSTGATAQEMEQYFLSIPGISPQLAAEIKSIGDPASTLPIPVPVNRMTSQNVTVQGVQGLAIADASGIGTAVVWQKDGMVYAVAGSVTEAQAIQIAEGLH